MHEPGKTFFGLGMCTSLVKNIWSCYVHEPGKKNWCWYVHEPGKKYLVLLCARVWQEIFGTKTKSLNSELGVVDLYVLVQMLAKVCMILTDIN